ncbi:MAG: DNA polymerase domain-containing protein [Candidatus Altiarchaeota archaeon]
MDAEVAGNKVALWVREKQKAVRFEADYTACFHVQGSELGEIEKKISVLGLDTSRVVVKDLVSMELRPAVEVRVGNLELFGKAVYLVERACNYEYELFNCDIDPHQAYLFEHDLSPLCEVEFEEDGGKITQIRKTASDPPLDLTVAHLAIETSYNPLIDFECVLEKIKLNNEEYSGSEQNILLGFRCDYLKLDPDVVVTEKGDSYLLDYLTHKFKIHGIRFSFGRDQDKFPVRDGKSFFSYGRVIRRLPPHYLRGRLHVDAVSFNYQEGYLEGIFDLARLTGMPVQKVARLSPGASITNLQLYTAYRLGYAVPYKTNMVEDFKTSWDLFISDKGGFIYEPKLGFHNFVAEIDFSSMYPNIMVNENISPETILCKCCQDNKVVPETGYNICKKRRGIVPQVLEPVIARRVHYKLLYEHTGEEKYKHMANSLKWILVTSFGYMGFRKSRFGRIEAHESITAFARELLLQAKDICEENGFRVLHGIVDSLWIQKPYVTKDEVDELAKKIEDKLKIPVKNEGLYQWIVFCPSVDGLDAPVPNRYYGVFKGGEAKVRGIELRRRDSPKIVKDLQREVIDLLYKAKDEGEFRALIPETIRVMRKYAARLKTGKVPVSELTIKKRVSKKAESYKSGIAAKAVIEQLERIGLDLEPGDNIKYIIRKADSRHSSARYTAVEQIIDERYDADKYIELLARSMETLLMEFGYDREKLIEMLESTKQVTLSE